MAEIDIILKEVKELKSDMKFLRSVIANNAGTAIQAKWVYKDEAMMITGLKERALMDRTILRDPVNGIFNVSQTGKSIRFWKADLERYVYDHSTLSQKDIMKKSA